MVALYNEPRLHGYLGDVPQAKFEDAYHAPSTTKVLVGSPITRASNKQPRAVQTRPSTAKPGR